MPNPEMCVEPKKKPFTPAAPVCEPGEPEPAFTPAPAPVTAGPATPASGEPFTGMYDGDQCVPLNQTPAHPSPEQAEQLKQVEAQEAAKAKEEAEKKKNIAIIQGYIDDAKKLDAEAKALEASGDKAGAAKKRAEAAAKKQSAVDKSITTYKIDTSNAKSVKYDPTTSGEGLTTPTPDNKKGIVTIGDDAFSSPQWLASSIGHETEGHVNKQLMKGNWYTGSVGTDLQEVEAYQYELDNAKRYGTSPADIKRLEKRRKGHYDALPADYKKKVDGNDYTMKKGEENK